MPNIGKLLKLVTFILNVLHIYTFVAAKIILKTNGEL